MHVPVVAGAYPRPFLGQPTSVVSSDRALAAKIAKQVHGVVNAKSALRNFIVISGQRARELGAHPAVPEGRRAGARHDSRPPACRRSHNASLPVRHVSPAPAAALLAALATAALLSTSIWSVGAICALLLVVALRAPAKRRWPYLIGTLSTALLFVVLTAVRRGDRNARALERPDDSPCSDGST